MLEFDPATQILADLLPGLPAAIASYARNYAAYYARCKRPDSPAMRDANPVVFLIPGIGMLTFAADKATARIAGEFYRNAINVMRGAHPSPPIAACRNRKPSTSNTGCWRKPNCSACPSPGPWPEKSR